MKSSGDLENICYDETDDPLHIHGDAGDLLPQTNAEYLVVEIVEGSKHSVGLVSRAMSQPMGTTGEKPPDAAGTDQTEGLGKPQKRRSSPDESPVAGSEDIAPDTSRKDEELGARNANAQNQQENREVGGDGSVADVGVEDLEDEDDDSPIVVGMEEAEEEAKATKKIWNATSRRRGAFRRGLVRCVMVMHEAHLTKLGPDFQDYDPLKEGQWHAGFSVASLTLADVLRAAEKAAEQLAGAEQSGRIKCAFSLVLAGFHKMQTWKWAWV